MEATFQLEPSDLKSLEKFLQKRSTLPPWVRRSLMVVAVVIGASIPILLPHQPQQRVIQQSGQSPLVGLLIMIALPVLFLIFWTLLIALSRRAVAKKHRSDPLFTTPSVLAISPDYLFHRNAGSGESKTFWSSIYNVGMDENAVYFLLSENTAHIAPTRAFASREAMQGFFQTAQKYWKIARGEELDPPIPAPAR